MTKLRVETSGDEDMFAKAMLMGPDRIVPKDCPDERLKMMRSPNVHQYVDLSESLKVTDLLWVAKPMAVLAAQAARQLEGTYERGMFSNPMANSPGLSFQTTLWRKGETWDERVSREVPVVGFAIGAIHWMPHPDGVHLTTLMKKYRERHWVVDDYINVRFGDSIKVDESSAYWMSLMLMADSPGVTDTDEERVQPAIRRRSKRSGVSVSRVRVIDLRGSSHHAAAHPGSPDRHHRWVVKGHWRQQPYGPGRSLRKPVWIRPHIKGPEGAPLLPPSEVVKVLR